SILVGTRGRFEWPSPTHIALFSVLHLKSKPGSQTLPLTDLEAVEECRSSKILVLVPLWSALSSAQRQVPERCFKKPPLWTADTTCPQAIQSDRKKGSK